MRATERGLTVDRLREVIDYDASTGHLTWKVSRGRSRAGSRAGNRHCKGYWVVHIDGKNHLAHRLAFALSHGEWPEHEVDHENRQRDDNRLINLRSATPGQNKANTSGGRGISGLKGVSLSRGRYRAQIQVNSKHLYLGTFDTPEMAHAAYQAAASQFFGAFARA
jgi:hypothetical protein